MRRVVDVCSCFSLCDELLLYLWYGWLSAIDTRSSLSEVNPLLSHLNTKPVIGIQYSCLSDSVVKISFAYQSSYAEET